MDDETRRISRLLAKGKVRGVEADDVLERVYERLDAQRAEEEQSAQGVQGAKSGQSGKSARPGRLRAIQYWGGAALAAAAAVLLVVFVPRGPTTDGRDVTEIGDLGTTPGPGAVPVLHVSCVPGTLEACPVTSSIVFSITGRPGAGGVLSAYAEPVGREGERVFFFSKEDGSGGLTVPGAGERAAERKARFPASQSAGRYRVHAVIADHAFDREGLIRVSADQTQSVGIRATVSVEVAITD